MSYFDYNKTCRTCLIQTNNFKNIYTNVKILNKQTTISDMIMMCSSVWIDKHDELPPNICLDCLDNLKRAFLFRKQCENADFTLKNNVQSPKQEENYSLSTENDDQIDSTTFKREFGLEINKQYSLFDCSFPKSNLELESGDKNPYKVVDKKSSEKKRKEYKCEECNEICVGLASYWKHLQRIHRKMYKCSDCTKEYKTELLLNQHRSTKHEKLNKTNVTELSNTCEICYKTFRFPENLDKHKLRHSEEKPYLCNICGKGYSLLSYLQIHTVLHTGRLKLILT